MHRFHLNEGSYRLKSYAKLVERALAAAEAPYLRYPGACPSWDNSSRHPRWAVVLHGSSPELYQRWLRGVIKRAQVNSDGDKIVFINAWNEWAEGCHLEPCQRWGRQYLEATARALHG